MINTKFNKMFVLILALFLTVCLVGCGSSDVNNQSGGQNHGNEKISVVTTIFPQYDFVRQIAKDKVELTMLLTPGAESHSYEPTPQDIIAVERCDMFINVGGQTDNWLSGVLEDMDNQNIRVISLLDCVSAVEEELTEGMQAEESQHSELDSNSKNDADNGKHDDGIQNDKEYDEHVWTSPKNAVAIVERITLVLCELDSENADFYQQNSAEYIAQLNDLDAEFKEVADGAGDSVIIVGDRYPFRYLSDAYGLEYFAAFPGCAAETEPSAATVAFLINKVKTENIPVVFYIEFSNEKIADTICEDTGAQKLLLHSCHNLSKDDYNAGVTYLDLMRQNAANLRTALK